MFKFDLTQVWLSGHLDQYNSGLVFCFHLQSFLIKCQGNNCIQPRHMRTNGRNSGSKASQACGVLPERPSLSCHHSRFICLYIWLRCPQVRLQGCTLTFDLFALENLCIYCCTSQPGQTVSDITSGEAFVSLPVLFLSSLLRSPTEGISRCKNELLLQPIPRRRYVSLVL